MRGLPRPRRGLAIAALAALLTPTAAGAIDRQARAADHPRSTRVAQVESAAGTWRGDLGEAGALTLTLKPDGTADVFGLAGKWEQRGQRVQIGSPDGASVGELTDGRLLVVVGGMPIVFVRVGASTGAPAAEVQVPRFKAARVLPGKTVAPKGAFASVRVPRGFAHRLEADVLVVEQRTAGSAGQVRVVRRALTPEQQQAPLARLLTEAVLRETEGAPTETVVAPEAVRVDRYDAARAELKAHVVGADGQFTKLDVDVFVVRADPFVYVFVGLWPEARRDALRPVLETMVSTFRYRRPTENKTLKRRMQGCWTRYRGSSTPSDGWGSASEGRYRFDGASGRFAYDGSTFVSGPGASASSETHEQGSFLVVGRTASLFLDDGAVRELSVALRGGMLELGDTRYLPCD